MQLSKTIIVTVALALFSTQVAAAPLNVTTSESLNTTETDSEASSTETAANEIPTEAVELPFSPESIIETVELGNDVAPIILDDAVYFVNTTVIESEYLQHSEGLQKREAEAWKWHTSLIRGQPFK